MFAYKLATSPRTKTPVSAHPKRTMEPITHPITEAKPIDWTSNQVLQLIREYGKRPALWDPDCEDNKNRFRKHQKWQELAAIFNCSKLEVERKMKILNSQYRRERLKAMRMRKAGEHHVVTWYGYSAFAFMNKNKHLAKKKFLMKNSGLQVIKIKQEKPDQEDPLSVAPKENEVDEVEKSKCETQEQNQKIDEWSLFGELVAHVLRKLPDDKTRCIVKHKMNTILYQAELATYENEIK